MGCCMFSSLLLPNLLVLGRFNADDESSDGEDAEIEDDYGDCDELSECESLAA